ncbi:hypothetical protein LPJ63_002353 [Coemansia sp. RSA 2711]|nr:hypothetical protein LPJ63_002353 [Coemansia sp. RSA 2711]
MFFASPYDIRGKVALVTGALGAIGRETSLTLANLGASLVLVDILPDSEGEKLCAQINQLDAASAIYVRADVRSSADIERMLAEGARAFCQIHIVVNIAGIALYKDFYLDEDQATIDAAFDINLRAPVELTRQFVKELRATGREGVVVNLASYAGLVPHKFFEVYGTTKAALIYFTQANRYLAPQIRVAAVAPFFVDTPMVSKSQQVKKTSFINPHTMLSVGDVARAVVRQIESRASGGSTVMLVGAWRLPVWMFDLMSVCVAITVYACWVFGWLLSLVAPTPRQKTMAA